MFIYYWYVRGFKVIIMADRAVRVAWRATRRNGPVKNVAVDIAGIVNNQIDVDSNSSSDNELLGKVVRAPHGSD